MSKISIDLNENNITLEELQLLDKLLLRASSLYHGSELRENMTENEQEKLSDTWFSINQQLSEYIESGYKRKDILK